MATTMAGSRRRTRLGFTIIEGIVAALIMALAIAGMFAGWNAIDWRYYSTREAVQAAQIGRGELERAKVYGADNLPVGSYDTNTQLGTWTGSYISSSGTWSSGGTAYYDLTGTPVASSTAAGVKFSAQMTITDSDVRPNLANTSYAFTVTSKRAAVITVRRISDSQILFTQGTNLVRGGI
ncbi:MAG: hypothetical protein JST12_13060 [Armatimonadetes bacterium]|nr:hypothetical protein [Armatimonadota bacterium]